MPYIIVNDSIDPPAYYGGQGFTISIDTVADERHAMRFPSLTAVCNGPLLKRPDLRAYGWRVVPVDK